MNNRFDCFHDSLSQFKICCFQTAPKSKRQTFQRQTFKASQTWIFARSVSVGFPLEASQTPGAVVSPGEGGGAEESAFRRGRLQVRSPITSPPSPPDPPPPPVCTQVFHTAGFDTSLCPSSRDHDTCVFLSTRVLCKHTTPLSTNVGFRLMHISFFFLLLLFPSC